MYVKLFRIHKCEKENPLVVRVHNCPCSSDIAVDKESCVNQMTYIFGKRGLIKQNYKYDTACQDPRSRD